MTHQGRAFERQRSRPDGRSPVPDLRDISPAAGALSGNDVLLATKLHLPRPQPGFVSRPRLVHALSQGLARGRALVCAPAGFGKTALLADWARGGARPVAWLGLDAGENDPAVNTDPRMASSYPHRSLMLIPNRTEAEIFLLES